MMMQKLALAGVLMAGLAACETAAPTGSAGMATASGIDGVVAAAQADVGKDIGGGVTLLSAQRGDDAIRFGFQFVATVDQIEALGRQEFEDGFTDGFVGSLCANPSVPSYLAEGNAIQVSMIDPAGASIISRRVTSC